MQLRTWNDPPWHKRDVNSSRVNVNVNVNVQKPTRKRAVCSAKRGAKYFENYKRNRLPHEGALLPRSPGTISLLPLDPLLEYLEQEVWAYTTGQPSPTQALAGRPLGAKPSVQELLAEEGLGETGPEGTTGLQVDGERKGVRSGVVIPPPATLQGPETHPPPTLRGKPYPMGQARVHVYWDVEAHHPGNSDPRILAHRIRRFASCYGKVAGIYAYAPRKAFNWVPEAFLREARYVGRDGGEPGGHKAVDEGGHEAASMAGARHRCPVCGAIKRSAQDLQAHLHALHPAATHKQGRERPSTPAGESSGSSGAATGLGYAPDSPRSPSSPASGVGDGAGGWVRSGGSGRLVARNTSRRTLGRVLLYYNSVGQALVPPVGHQLSLKYSLMQEGIEARIVQNSAESASSSVTNGMNRLLSRMRRGEVDTSVQTVIIAISDDEENIQKPLLRLRGMGGAATIAVCNKGGGSDKGDGTDQADQVLRYRGADCVASWKLLASGVYITKPGILTV